METLLRTPKLLPIPQSVIWGNGFLEWTKAEFQIDENGLPCGDFLSIVESPEIASPEGYNLSISSYGIEIVVANQDGARRALNTLQQIGMQADERGFRFCEIIDFPSVEVRTFSLNLSQNRVPTFEQLKLLVDRIALFKYNRLELRITNAFPFENYESQWTGRAVISSSKIARLKNYCAGQGVELTFAYDLSAQGTSVELLKLLSNTFDCSEANIECVNIEKKSLCEFVNDAVASDITPSYCADSFVSTDFDVSDLPLGIPIFSARKGDALENVCDKLKSQNRKFYLCTDMCLQKFSDYAQARKQTEMAEHLANKYGASGIIADFSLGEITPMCLLYPQLVFCSSAMWSTSATDESVCDALESFIFYDDGGDFSRAIFAMGNVIKSQLLFDLFFADEEMLNVVLSKNNDIDFDVLEGSADFAMGLSANAHSESRDSNILSAELALTGAMMKWASQKARCDESAFNSQQLALKFIIADFENVWLARCECGGLWETSAKLRALLR